MRYSEQYIFVIIRYKIVRGIALNTATAILGPYKIAFSWALKIATPTESPVLCWSGLQSAGQMIRIPLLYHLQNTQSCDQRLGEG